MSFKCGLQQKNIIYSSFHGPTHLTTVIIVISVLIVIVIVISSPFFFFYFFQQSFYVFCIVVCIPLLALRVENEALVRESSCAEPNSEFMAVRLNGDFSPEQEK